MFKFEYAGEDDIPLELFLRGMVSLTLTVLNILCIIGVGVLILFVKQVTPESIPQRNASFWKTDLALNKEYELSRTKEVRYFVSPSIHHIHIKYFKPQQGDEENSDLSGTFIAALFEEASKDQDVIERKEWIEKNYPITTFTEKRSVGYLNHQIIKNSCFIVPSRKISILDDSEWCLRSEKISTR